MHPQYTYELAIAFASHNEAEAAAVKEKVKSWLTAEGIESYVEGSLDNLDIDHEWTDPNRDYYGELGGNATPLGLFSYHSEYLQSIQAKLLHAFPGQLTCELKSMVTSTWMEGWKDSFKPISTRRFYIYPPWEGTLGADERILLEIDPGMAFGTGQHATTQICLRVFEDMFAQEEEWQGKQLLDVGTGSGILAIAALKLGCGEVDACDIDIDSIAAARENSRKGGVSPRLWQGSLPSPHGTGKQGPGHYDVVVANILYVVLAQIINGLAAEVKPGGLLVLSGLLVEQEPQMLAGAIGAGLTLRRSWQQEGWAALLMEKKL